MEWKQGEVDVWTVDVNVEMAVAGWVVRSLPQPVQPLSRGPSVTDSPTVSLWPLTGQSQRLSSRSHLRQPPTSPAARREGERERPVESCHLVTIASSPHHFTVAQHWSGHLPSPFSLLSLSALRQPQL